MTETSIPRPSKTELYQELHALADQYFNGPFKHPDTREAIGRKLRDLLLTLDLREAVE